ncbi:citryl-CoA lyase [Saccharopolyspora pogona]|uniref:citryl-CoA lyase n=1 Tax=Saccharopolyspora pogona TaxID=333966 RepID=UPI001683C595|nr:citryl-CoA lyase [Saccharopolyspora pogona]
MPTAPDTYWRSEVSKVKDGKVFVRGYDLENLIGKLPFTAAVFLLVRGRLPSPRESRVLDAVLTAVLDYSLQKPGTVAARYVVSANPNMPAGLATASLAVGEYTLATEEAARFISTTHEQFTASGVSQEKFAEQVVAECAANRTRIPGFGHPLFKNVDPRAAILKQIAMKAGLWNEACRLYEAIHSEFIRSPRKADFPINDVGMMAAVMTGLGFTPEESTGLAIISTLPGVVAHVSEELRSGKPIRVVPETDATYDVAEDGKFLADWKDAGWNHAE